MANNDQLMHFDISTPRLGPQQSSGRPLAFAANAAGAAGAGGGPVHGDVRMLSGAGSDPMQYRRANGQPSSFQPGRDGSRTPRRDGAIALLRGERSPSERGEALSLYQAGQRRQTPMGRQFWAQCTEDALRVQQQRFEEVAPTYMMETKQAVSYTHLTMQKTP